MAQEILSSNDLRKALRSEMARWLQNPVPPRKGGTAGTENPVYFLYWTDEYAL